MSHLLGGWRTHDGRRLRPGPCARDLTPSRSIGPLVVREQLPASQAIGTYRYTTSATRGVNGWYATSSGMHSPHASTPRALPGSYTTSKGRGSEHVQGSFSSHQREHWLGLGSLGRAWWGLGCLGRAWCPRKEQARSPRGEGEARTRRWRGCRSDHPSTRTRSCCHCCHGRTRRWGRSHARTRVAVVRHLALRHAHAVEVLVVVNAVALELVPIVIDLAHRVGTALAPGCGGA